MAVQQYDVVIVGAGAAGLMAAATAGYGGRRVLLLDHAGKAGKKILMSGGGRCNFTNLNTLPEHFVSANPHFCKSALYRYPPREFLELVERHGVDYVEKAPGQLFCAGASKEILGILLTECDWAGVEIRLNTEVLTITAANLPLKGQQNCHFSGPTPSGPTPSRGRTRGGRTGIPGEGFRLGTEGGDIDCRKLVIATGGLSIPTLGASPFGYRVAEQFGLNVLPTRAALVPFTLQPKDKAWLAALSGVSTDVVAEAGGRAFSEPLLITHRGLSGPAMLQVSTFWEPGRAVTLDWLPTLTDPFTVLRKVRREQPSTSVEKWLRGFFSQRLAATLAAHFDWQGPLQHQSDERLAAIAATLKGWQLKPAGTEGYRTAEVTLGGIDTDGISSRTFEAKAVPGLYFIGEVLDVTGQLGGFNFQWAWASGQAVGHHVAKAN